MLTFILSEFDFICTPYADIRPCLFYILLIYTVPIQNKTRNEACWNDWTLHSNLIGLNIVTDAKIAFKLFNLTSSFQQYILSQTL